MRNHLFRAIHLCFVLLLVTSFAAGQHVIPAARITQKIDPNQRTTLQGNVHPLARAQFDRGAAPDSMLADRMILILSRSDEQEAALRQLLDEQQSAGSPNFHKWLTPEEFGQQFGPADTDVQTVMTWLLNNGFQVTDIAPGKTFIEFSGTAGQLRQAFHTDIHKYVIHGQERWANATDPQVPTALAPVIHGIASLNNFPRKPQARKLGPFKRNVQTGEVSPMATTSGTPPYYLLAPGDFSVIYGSNAAFQAGTNGSGQTIAIVGQTNINLQDVTDFRTLFGLPMTPDNHTSVIVNGPDPGVNDDEMEADLDVQWAGASAPGASIVLVVSGSTVTTAGVDLSALYIVQHNLAPVMSESYGGCEAYMGNAANLFYQQLWEQAAAQGITVVVSSGDNGSAGCDDPNTVDVATQGTAVSGIASTPFNVAVGGTDFNDVGAQATYFNTANTSTYVSAKSYIPEIPWNDSCAGGTSPTTSSCTSSSNLQLWSGSGGPSSCSKVTSGTCSGTPKPNWQTGTGVPADGVRDIPDISIFAATGASGSHSFYMMCQADQLGGAPSCVQQSDGYLFFVPAAGTSMGAPTFAGAIALANQKAGHRLGNVNYLLYQIAAQSGMTCPTSSPTANCVFHDVTLGGNSVPCQGGTSKCSATSSSQTGVLVESGNLAYKSTTGYDRVTGLGSPNINNLVNKLASASFTTTTTTLTLNGAAAAVNAAHGQPISVGVGVSPTASTGAVSIIGNHGSSDDLGIDSATLVSGAANWNSTLFPGGSYNVHAHYPGDGSRGASDSTLPGIAVTISPENSKTFVNLVTFDLNGYLKSYTSTGAEYGSPYVVRMDVGDSTSTVSSTTGFSSKCVSGTVSCPTGTLTVTANGSKLDGKDWPLNSAGFSEDDPIQLAPGTYNIVANYPGDESYNASSGSTSFTIGKATSTVVAASAQLPPYQYGSLVDIGAWLTTQSNGVAPTGTFSFFDNTSPITPSTLVYEGFPGSETQGATLTAGGLYPFSTLGAHSLTVNYSGDVNYASAGPGTPFNLTVSQGPTWFNSYYGLPNPSTPSLPVTLSADVFTNSSLDQPTGSVTFYDNGTALTGSVGYTGHPGSWNNSGGGNYIAVLTATLSHTFTQTGSHTITASYSGDSHYLPSSATALTLNVNAKLATQFSLVRALNDPAVANQPNQLLAFLTPANGAPPMTGTITFYDGGTVIPGAVSYDPRTDIFAARLDTTFTTIGTHSITATYSGDSIYATTTSQALSLNVVGPFSLTASVPADISTAGGNGSTSVDVSANGGFNGQVALTCAVVPSTATCSVNPSSVNLNGNTVVAAVNYTIPAISADMRRPGGSLWDTAGGIFLAGVFLLGLPGLKIRNRIAAMTMALCVALCLVSCGGGSSTIKPPPPPPPTATYTMTITGTSGASTATTTLTLKQH